jgi:hypothetical protein
MALCGICLPMFRDNVSVPSLRVKKSHWNQEVLFDFLTLEDGCNTVSQNVGKQLPPDGL